MLLKQLHQKIREKTSESIQPCHKLVIAMGNFELVLHAPYSTDLAPSEFSLFSNLKKITLERNVNGYVEELQG